MKKTSQSPHQNPQSSIVSSSIALAIAFGAFSAPTVQAQDSTDKQLDDVVVSASRTEQRRFDTAASIDAVQVDAMRAATPLVNMSELMGAVPGLQIRERQNYAQDLQISVRGFGTRSTFGVRGVRILIDGIPATMPDGQGQAASASLTSTKRIEVLRGPAAQLYGNAAGGVVQVFTNDPPLAPDAPSGGVYFGAGSHGQRQIGATAGGGTETLGALVDVSQFETDGYRDHSAARRIQLNAKVLAKPSADTTITGIYNLFQQPLSQDPLGLTRAQFLQNPRQVAAVARQFDTRKTIDQHQLGATIEHRLSSQDTLNARVYGGVRQVFQTLSFSGAAANSAGGVVDLDNDFHGAGVSWTHRTRVGTMPLSWTIGAEADRLSQERRGFVNNNGTPGALRRDETDQARNNDVFGQLEWSFQPQWKATAGVRSSRVKLSVDDRYITAASPNDSGSVEYRNTSPVLGLVWFAREDLNFYGNLGRGFETPTITEIAYRQTGTGPNFGLRPSKSTQGEVGMKYRSGRHVADLALFRSESTDEIVPLANINGRSIFQNVDDVERQGIEASLRSVWGGGMSTKVGYTFLDAEFGRRFTNAAGAAIAAGNQLPAAPRHSFYGEVELRPSQPLSMAVEVRADSKVFVDDVNSEAAPGYAVVNLRTGYTFRAGGARVFLFGRLDNLFDRDYAGSVIVNEGNRRFYEPATGRRLFVGVRTMF